MKEYTCESWKDVPQNLKTKTSLNEMGIFNLCKVSAKVKVYGKLYNLYDINQCLKVEQSRGNKTLMINSYTSDHYLIMEMNTTGSKSTDEILELIIIDLNGRTLFQKKFKVNGKHAYYFNETPVLFEDTWEEMKEIIKGKIILVPNTIYAKRLISQTCEKHQCEMFKNIHMICSKSQIQHKVSLLTILNKKKEEKQVNPKDAVFHFLSVIYPKSELYFLQRKATIYFDKLCEHRTKLGDPNGRKKGLEWLTEIYHNTDFSTFSYEQCTEIINLIYPVLYGLGKLPKRIE